MGRLRNWMVTERWGLIGLLAVWLVFFGRILFLNQVYWLDDIKLVFYPLEFVYGEFFRAGQLPVWSPTFGFGHPLLSWGQLGFLSPLHILLRLFDLHPLRLMHVSMVVHFAWGMVGMYALLRKWRTSQGAAVLGAVVLILSGYNLYHIQHVNFFVSVMWVPWLVMVLLNLIERPNSNRAILLGVVSAVVALSGHAQIVLYVYILAGLVGLFLWRNFRWQQVLLIVLAGGLGLGLAALAVLPVMEFLPYIDRNEGIRIDELYNFSYPPEHAAALIWPTVFGDRGAYWGAKSRLELGWYVGVIPLLLAGVALTRWAEMKRLRLMAVGLLIVGLILGLGKYSFVFRLLVENGLFPPFTAPARWLLLASFAVAVLAALGWDDLKRISNKSPSQNNLPISRPLCTNLRLFLNRQTLIVAVLRFVFGSVGKAASRHILNKICPSYFGMAPKSKAMALVGGIGLVLVVLLPWLVAYGRGAEIERIEWWLSVAGLLSWLGWVLIGRQRWIGEGATIIISVGTIIWLGWQVYPLTDWERAVKEPAFAQEIREWGEEQGYPARVYSEPELWQEGAANSGQDLKKTEELHDNFWVRQEFWADKDELACLRIGLDVLDEGQHQVRMELRESNQVVAEKTFQVAEMDKSGAQVWCFDRSLNSAGKKYEFSIKAGGGVAVRYDPAVDAGLQLLRVKDPSVEQLEQSRKPFSLVLEKWHGQEVDDEQMLLSAHLQATAGAGSARWIGSISVRRYRDFVRDMFANDGQTRDGTGKHVLESNREAFDRAGVSHFVQVVGPGALDTMERHGFKMVGEEVVRDKRYRLYENLQVYPKAWLEGDSEGKTRDLINGQVKLVTYEPTIVEFEVETDKDVRLVLADTYVPMWRAMVDDDEVRIEVANDVFRAVRVPAGIRRVKFEYISPATELSLRLMVAAMLLGLLWWLISNDVDKLIHVGSSSNQTK